MPPEAPTAPDPTILGTPAPVTPKPPEDQLFTPPASATPPAPEEPPVTPPVTPPAPPAPATPPVVTPPATPPEPPKPPTEPSKPGEPASPAPAPKDVVLKLPEGSLLTQAELTAITKEAKDAGMTQEEAEGMLEAKSEAVKVYDTRVKADLAAQAPVWKGMTEKDPEISGVGGKDLAQNIATANRAYQQFCPPGLKAIIKSAGLENHPEVVRQFLWIGREFAEDTLVRGSIGDQPKGKRAPEDVMFAKPIGAAKEE